MITEHRSANDTMSRTGPDSPRVMAAIPAFNEAAHIAEVVQRSASVC